MEIDELTFVVKNEPEVIAETLAEEWFRRTPTGLVILKENPPLEAFELMGLILIKDIEKLFWQFGDWAESLAEVHKRIAYEQIAAKLLSERRMRTVEHWAYVARNVPKHVRREDLTFSHHWKVAPLNPDAKLQEYWLEKSVQKKLSVRQLGLAIAISQGKSPPPRQEDLLFEMGQQNAALHRQVDNLTHERDSAWSRSERSESILESIRSTLAKLVEGGPEGVARDPEGAFRTLKSLMEQISNR